MHAVKEYSKVVGGVLLALALLIGLIMGAIAGFKAFGRYQTIADAKNKVHATKISVENARTKAENQVEVNRIRIDQQEQRVKIAEQNAEIRKTNAQGIRAAQDEIAKTLTPLYVQFEMTEALKKIATSGKNNTVIYIPTGPDGLPLVADATRAGR